MKIRIGDQSLRVRLFKEEAMQVYEGNAVFTELRLNAIDVFTIELRSWNLTIAEIHFEDHQLHISIPEEAAHHIATQAGYCYRFDSPSDAAKPVKLTVEIDFEKVPHS
jgi:hypothetical protein